MKVSVRLKNAPAAGSYWQILISNSDKTDGRFAPDIPMDGIAEFTDLPEIWGYRYLIDLIVYQWIVVGESSRQIYRIQSYWGAEDPDYKDIVIPYFGDYYFNFTTEEFEPVTFGGAITSRKLAYNGASADIPATGAPQGKTAQATFTCKNNSSVPLYMGMSFVANDPGGVEVTRFDLWYSEMVSPGEEHDFASDLFILGELGDYTCIAELYLNTEGAWSLDSVLVDSYEGMLCTVSLVYEGTIIRIELQYDETTVPVPASDVPMGMKGIVIVTARNDMAMAQRMGISWIVTDPDGTPIKYAAWEDYPYTGGGSEHRFIGGRFYLNKSGNWMLNVILAMNPDNPETVDQYYGKLCSVSSEPPPEAEFTNLIVTYKKA